MSVSPRLPHRFSLLSLAVLSTINATAHAQTCVVYQGSSSCYGTVTGNNGNFVNGYDYGDVGSVDPGSDLSCDGSSSAADPGDYGPGDYTVSESVYEAAQESVDSYMSNPPGIATPSDVDNSNAPQPNSYDQALNDISNDENRIQSEQNAAENAFNSVGGNFYTGSSDGTGTNPGAVPSGTGDDGNDDSFGDPISTSLGNVTQTVRDYRGTGTMPLNFDRIYNSLPLLVPGYVNSFGSNWRGTYDASIVVNGNTATVYRADGKAAQFTLVNGAWQSTSGNVVSSLQQLTQAGQAAGWLYTTESQTTETYAVNGHLTSITNVNGQSQTLSYGANGLLTSVTDPAGRVLQFSYDSNNRLVTLTRPDGNTVQYSYDGENNLIGVTYPDGSTRGYEYQNSAFPHLLTAKLDGTNTVVSSWTYNSQGQAIGNQGANGVSAVTASYTTSGTTSTSVITDAAGVTRTRQFTRIGGQFQLTSVNETCSGCEANLNRTVTYDSNGFIASASDFNGHSVQYTRNARGSILTKTIGAGTPLAQTTTYTWHAVFRKPLSITLSNKTVIAFQYDNNGNLTKRTVTAGNSTRTWTFQYNSAGQVTQAQGPRTDIREIVTYTYDAQGNVASIINALKQTVHFTSHDANGNVLSATDPNGIVSTFTYDANGRRTASTTGTHTTQTSYNANGQRASITLPNGNTYTYGYDAAQRLTEITDATGNALHLTRDTSGRIIQRSLTSSSGATQSSRNYAFDVRGRLIQQSGNNGQQVSYTYDPGNNLLSATDALNRTIQKQYDALVRLTQTTDARGGVTQYGYDANNQVASVTSARGVTTQYLHDGFGQVTTLTSPDTGKTQYQYDSTGNAISRTDAKGNTTHISYDALNRPVIINYGNKQQASITYDQGKNGIGRITEIDNNSAGNRFQYDADGHIIQEQERAGLANGTVNFSYTSAGQLSSIQYPSSNAVEYTYTSDGRIATVAVNGTTIIINIQYQADGRAVQWTWGNGQTFARGYDSDGRLNSFTKFLSSTSILYDSADRITGQNDSNNSKLNQSYGYSNNDELTSYINNSTGQSTTYDLDGNRTIENNGSSSTNYQIASTSNRLLKLSGAQNDAPQYDATGNILNDGKNSYSYDSRGKLVQVSNRAGSTQYIYNALGQRVAKLNGQSGGDFDSCGDHGNSSNTYYAYDTQGRLIGEYNSNRSQSTEYVWIGNTPVAVVQKNGNSAKTYYVYTDQLNTPRQVTDSQTSNLVWQWYGEPFGTSLPDQDPNRTGKQFTLNLRYAGQYFDQESGLFHNGARDYSAQWGRYVESDPIGLGGGINTYSYGGGNPVSKTDPRGLDNPNMGPYGPAMSANDYVNSYLNQSNGNGTLAWQAAYNDRSYSPDNLNLRDAEHYLWAYSQVQDNSYNWGVQIGLSTIYSPLKAIDSLLGKPVWPDATPPSFGEMGAGIKGANDGLFGRCTK